MRTLRVDESIYSDQFTDCAKPSIADSPHDDQMFRAPERPEFFAMLDDTRGEGLADSRQRFQFVHRSTVDVDEMGLNWRRVDVFRYGRALVGRLVCDSG